MMAKIIDGKAIAKTKRDEIEQVIKEKALSPGLAIILANENPASEIYVSRKIKACHDIGINPTLHKLPINVSHEDITKLIQSLNEDHSIHGIFLQLPIGDHLNSLDIIQHIDPQKDVDGLTYTNMGRVISGNPILSPCTPKGVMDLLNHENVDLNGKHAVVIGRSLLFGKPMASMLLNANCTVTQCHSKTIDLPSITKQADILIAAVGQPKMVKAAWVKDNVIVIDVGINRLENGKIIGDVDFDEVSKIAGAITPVPGGVGPMTVANLLSNTVIACEALTNG